MELESGIAAFETKNFAHAIKLLSPIAEEGNSEAMYRMAIMLQNGLGCIADEAKAFRYMESAAKNEYPLAQHALGFMYFEGECTEKTSIRVLSGSLNQRSKDYLVQQLPWQ